MRLSFYSQLALIVAGASLMMSGEGMQLQAEQPLVLISAFAPGEQGGIHAFRFDQKTGELTQVHRNGDIPNPFFMDVSPDRKFLYSIFATTFGGKESEQVSAFALDTSSGKLTPLNRQTTRGTASCFVEVDSTGKSLLVANYSSGSVVSYSLLSDGTLSEPVSFVQHAGSSVNEARQKQSHAHCFVISPNNRFAYAADLGIDQIVCYQLDSATGQLTPNIQAFVRTPPGSGPRHLTFHPSGQFLYVINELLNTVTLFSFDPDSGILIERQTISTLPADFDGVTHTADLKITPDGRFLYGTNRGHDSIAAFGIAEDGTLSLIEIIPSRGKGPQNLAVTRDGGSLICANMAGNSVAVFKIAAETGQLSPAGELVEMPGPSCIRILE